VADQCDGIGSVSTINASLDYLYERSGTGGGATIHSKFTSSGVKQVTLTRDFANAEAGKAQWNGKMTGSAFQSETMNFPDGGEYTLNSTGAAFTSAQTVLTVDLALCTYRVVTTLIYPIMRTDNSGTTGGVNIEKADQHLGKKNDANSYFGNLPPFQPYTATTNAIGPGDIFVVSGFAQNIESGLGFAEVSYTLSAAGTNNQLQAAASPRPLSLIGAFADASKLLIRPRQKRE